ncbi:MAG: hypothetical protein AB7S39_15180, partial [Gemmatimonadales bacterium]
DWNAPTGVWSDDDAGRWQNGVADVDLTARITAVGTYRVRFVGRDGPATLRDPVLTVGGTPSPHLVRRDPGRGDVVFITISEIGQPIRLRSPVAGSRAGSVVIRRA